MAMFRLEAELELLRADQGIPSPPPSITLRGHLKEQPVAVTGQFIDASPLSVSDIVGFCPVHRDLYLRKIKKHKREDKSKNKSWARLAGPLIQKFLEHVYDSLKDKKSPNSVGNSPAEFRKEVSRLLDGFVRHKGISNQIKNLNSKVMNRFDLRENELRLLLFNSAVLDLFYLQGALNYKRATNEGPDVILSALQTKYKYTPATYLKISADSSPDLLLPKFNAIGDVKSGMMKEEHFWTVAGYALGYESAFQKDIDLGVLYFVETANDCIRSSRTIIFWLSDDLRRRFLDRRDRALATLHNAALEPMVLTDQNQIDEFCNRCSFQRVCHPE